MFVLVAVAVAVTVTVTEGEAEGEERECWRCLGREWESQAVDATCWLVAVGDQMLRLPRLQVHRWRGVARRGAATS